MKFTNFSSFEYIVAERSDFQKLENSSINHTIDFIHLTLSSLVFDINEKHFTNSEFFCVYSVVVRRSEAIKLL